MISPVFSGFDGSVLSICCEGKLIVLAGAGAGLDNMRQGLRRVHQNAITDQNQAVGALERWSGAILSVTCGAPFI